jgi:hypothetical protein
MAAVCLLAPPARAAGAGSLQGLVVGPDGQPMAGVSLQLRNDVTGFRAEAISGTSGSFQFVNVPFNPYELRIETAGFRTVHRAVDVRTTAPLDVRIALELAGVSESVTVEAGGTGVSLETGSSISHVDIDRSFIARSPATVASRAMEELITSTPGFAKDENGRYHFQGAHSQGQFVIDGQTISDQTGATFSNSIDPGIAQSVEVVYGNVPAEYGEKTGTVVNLSTRSGLGSPFHADVHGGAARFASYEGGASLSAGSRNLGVFASLNGSWSDRFLDPVNPDSLHDSGSTRRGFVRLDYASSDLRDQFRLTTLLGSTHRDVPNTYTQQDAGQDQRVRSDDQNYNLGWTRVISTKATLDVNGFVRQSSFRLAPSPGDTPVTSTSDRSLDNRGLNAALTVVAGAHELKLGGTLKRFPIREHFAFGITDPSLNDPEAGDYNPGLAPFDLTRGGQLLVFDSARTGTYAAGFVQDTLRRGGLTASLGLRLDHNTLPTTESQLQPRVGLAYHLKATGTVLRGSYNRVFFTPEYENILFSSSELAASLVPPAVRDARPLGGGLLPVRSERQNAFTVGAQQALGDHLRLDLDFWWRRSRNAGDQDQFQNTGVVFPIAFDGGRFHGWDVRLDLAQTAGVRGFLSLGHTRAIYDPPPVGGLFLDQAALQAITAGPFLIDHDQALQLQAQFQWDLGHSGAWLGAGVRHDSGLVTDADPAGLASDPDNAFAAPFVKVNSGADLDPNRIRARTVASFSAGLDLARHGVPVCLQVDLLNAFDTAGVYNIQSVFGGTHVIPPRTLAARLRYSFGSKRG